MSQYWSGRFAREGMIWGNEPSPSAEQAREVFRMAGVGSVLVPGAGYGRNTKVFSEGFTTYGIELSKEAVELAQQWDPKTVFIAGSALEPQLDRQVDAVYCYDVLHLFLEEERQRLIEACLAQLQAGGLLYFTSFSDEDPNNGCGHRLEPGTYEYKEGKYAHFFSDGDLRSHFSETEITESGSFLERLHSSTGGTHEYILRYIIARKRD
ncbi:methyltransferase type 11 [Paenibacillus sp. FSL R7-0273]|uniref:class I SAM-dependent methyltransferase n=1 Tax=Paenibacillus sp. FSL R7-0273 TaxID=1536772 RepID=UPI0004F78C1B|nr:class I SAM-dependent methyltransferase [Paenibacillus sp. FSL R7-0273]AIQ46388.1 methyltransferase type 11 [Paenibacillus sp. FSL R7-0273]OMF85722.1 SAM-dependent methyltransferase [Paenibacillus sp. FSL R7-0273]